MKKKLLRRISAMALAITLATTTLFSMSGILKAQTGEEKAKAANPTTFVYTELGIGDGGWTTGSTTQNVTSVDGVISGQTGSTSDPTVLTLDRGAANNTYMLEAGNTYTITATYKAEAKLMFFVGDWMALSDAAPATEWTTIQKTFTSATSGSLPIYIQNWGGGTPEGDFAIKEMKISKVTTDVKFDFVQYDYTDIKVGGNGWKAGSATKDVKVEEGVIAGQTTSSKDAAVLTLETGFAGNTFQLEAKTQYKLSVTFMSEVKLMFFCGDWTAITTGATASEDWTTASVTFTTGAKAANLPIYIQNWDHDHPAGAFRIKEIYLSRVADTKTLKTGAALGTLPSIQLPASDKYHEMVWMANGVLLSASTAYSEDLGKVAIAREREKEHKLKKVAGQKADCQHDGWKDYYICENKDCLQGSQASFHYDTAGKLTSFTDFDTWKLAEGKIPSTGECAYTVYQSDKTSHWMVCQSCGNTKAGSKTTHKCNQKVEEAIYLKSQATCKKAMTYYQSCVCGYCDRTAKTPTFTVGKANAHQWTAKGATVSEHKCAACGTWQEHTYEKDVCTVCSYDMGGVVHFVQYDYGTIPVGSDGWQPGDGIQNVKNTKGVLSGELANGSAVLTLGTTEKNTFMMKKGVKYRITLTYQSDAKLMIFADGWNAMMPQAMAAKDWETVTITVTPEVDRKMTIYIQNWDNNVKSGTFRVKDLYLSKVSDGKAIKEGETFGTLPKFDCMASDNSHKLVWKVRDPKTGKEMQISGKMKFSPGKMGSYAFATEILAPHSKNAHWWSNKGAGVTYHKCSVCGVKEEHTYEADRCTVCGYDLGKAIKYNICNYTTVSIGQGGWEVGATTKNVKYKDGTISGKTGTTKDPAVMSLYAHSDLNPYVMEAGVTYRVSITYKSDAALMIFCDAWKNFTTGAEASKEWKTLTLTIRPETERKLAIYIQNWDHTNPVGAFAFKDLTIAKISDSKTLKNGKALGQMPELTYAPTDEFHEFIWYAKKKSGTGYVKVTPSTKYNSKTMGSEILPIETKVYHSVLNYVRCDLQEVDSWVPGEAVQNGSFSRQDGILKMTLGGNTVGKTAISFSDGKGRMTLESGVEYKVILTYKSSKSFGVFMDLKSDSWTEAPGKCLASIGDDWKTITATFKSAAGDVFNGALIQSWNDEKPYTLQIREFCIVKAEDTRKFTGNEAIGKIPACQGEDDALGRYVYKWNLTKANGTTMDLSSSQHIRNLTAAAGGEGALYAKEELQCVYHMDDGIDYGKKPTCTEGGWNSYWKCQTCGTCFADNLCRKEIKDVKAWQKGDGKLEATGHVHTMELLALDGTVYYYCDCHKLFAKEGETYVEVSFSVLDTERER